MAKEINSTKIYEKAYDKPFDKLLKSIFTKSAEKILKDLGFNIKIEKLEPVEKIKITQKLIPDLILMGNIENTPVVFHIEFQKLNDPNMLNRMGEYLFRIREYYSNKYKVSQLVLFIGNETLKMNNKIDFKVGKFQIYYQCPIIDIKKLDAKKFLSSKDPDEKIFGLMTSVPDFINSVKEILKELKSTHDIDIKEYAQNNNWDFKRKNKRNNGSDKNRIRY
ncbi:MAG: hypothetical protein ACTSRP_08480 [Candidatus Helarchaeota archaeon]